MTKCFFLLHIKHSQPAWQASETGDGKLRLSWLRLRAVRESSANSYTISKRFSDKAKNSHFDL